MPAECSWRTSRKCGRRPTFATLRHVTVIPRGVDSAMTERERAGLRSHDAALAPEPMACVHMWRPRITVQSGPQETACNAIYCALGREVHSSKITAPGAQADEDGLVAGQ